MTEKKIIYISDLRAEWIDGGWCEGITLVDFIQAYRESGYTIIYK